MDLLEDFGGKVREGVILHAVTDLNRVAADFAIFDVSLTANGEVQDHRDFFPAIGAVEGVFHETLTLSMTLATPEPLGSIHIHLRRAVRMKRFDGL